MRRREFLERAAALGLVVPTLGSGLLTACASGGAAQGGGAAAGTAPLAKRPDDWDAIKYNLERGAAGAIPAKYMADITGADGIPKHLGKHLPYLPKLSFSEDGWIGVMWGDPAKGYAKHPNAPKSEANPEGHWYNWIKIAIDGQPETEVETTWDGWPEVTAAATGKLMAADGGDISADGGKGTVYLARVPKGVAGGTTLRIWAHCLTHGEYLDFVTV
jgi:hypothetical protein